jgi:hypothetical protein
MSGVPGSCSRDFYKKLKKENADVRYTEYPNIFHDSWLDAFAEPELFSWMFSNQNDHHSGSNRKPGYLLH